MDELNLDYPLEERKKAAVLVVEPQEETRQSLQRELAALGFGGISLAADHGTALSRLVDRFFSHVIFTVDSTTINSTDFLFAVLRDNPAVTAIAVSSKPDTDELFDFLMLGAKGYLISPWNRDGLEEVIVEATKGEPVPEELLRAPDKSEALISALANDLDQCARAMKRTGGDKNRIEDQSVTVSLLLKRSVQRVLAFTKGGETEYLQKLEEFLLKRGKGPSSRLGRLRKQLARERSGD